MKKDWFNFQGEIKEMQSANHSERNKKYRKKILDKSQKRILKNLDKE